MITVYRLFLRWAFQRFYNEFAWTYDMVAAIVSRGYWQCWVEAAVPLIKGDRVLELACGTGYAQRALRQRGAHAVGIDGSAYMLRHTRRKLRRAGLQSTLAQAYTQRLPFADGVFSDVVATFPAEYILDPHTHAEAWRVLQPDGQFVVIDAGYFVRRTAYTVAVDVAYRATGQVRCSDPRSALMASAGFVVTERWLDVGDTRVQALIGSKVGANDRSPVQG
jgi:ubiquinone/menaquinone biosynthesis C-methylase UbiE